MSLEKFEHGHIDDVTYDVKDVYGEREESIGRVHPPTDVEAYPVEPFPETGQRVDAVFGVQNEKGPNYRNLGW